MEDTASKRSDEMIERLSGITSVLEDQIGSFRLFGRDLQGDIESGFAYNPGEPIDSGEGEGDS